MVPPCCDDDAAADGETEAGAAFLAGVAELDLLEAVEDGVELFRGDAAAAVFYAENEVVAVVPESRRTGAPGGENLMALERRLQRTWRMRSGSPSKTMLWPWGSGTISRRTPAVRPWGSWFRRPAR